MSNMLAAFISIYIPEFIANVACTILNTSILFLYYYVKCLYSSPHLIRPLVLAGKALLILAGKALLILAGKALLILAGKALLILAGKALLVLAGKALLVLLLAGKAFEYEFYALTRKSSNKYRVLIGRFGSMSKTVRPYFRWTEILKYF